MKYNLYIVNAEKNFTHPIIIRDMGFVCCICVRNGGPLGRRLAGCSCLKFLGARLRFMRLGGNGVNRATHKI